MNLEQAARQLDSSEAAVRQEAADFLSRQGEEVARVAAVVARHVGDDDRIVAEYCVAALEEMGPADPSQLPGVGELLCSPSTDVVFWCATLLGRAKGAAAPYASLLVEAAAGDLPAGIRQRVVWAIRQIGPAASPVAPQLEALARRSPSNVQREIAQALEAIAARPS